MERRKRRLRDLADVVAEARVVGRAAVDLADQGREVGVAAGLAQKRFSS